MDKSTKQYLIIGSVTVVVGILGFIAYKHFTKPELVEDSPAPNPSQIQTEQEKQMAQEMGTSTTAPTTRPLVNIQRR